MKINVFFKILLLGNILIFAYCYDRSTAPASNGGGNIIYLDRHNVYCNAGEVLTGFHLVSNGGNINYEYSCMANDAILPGSYEDATTWASAADDIFAENISADRLAVHVVRCKNDFGLKGFRVQTECGRPICNMRIAFTCVPMKVVSIGSNYSGWIDAGDGQVYTLNGLWVQMGPYQALTGFNLNANFYVRWFKREGRYFRYYYAWSNLRDVNTEEANYVTSVKNGVKYSPPFNRLLKYMGEN